jgi:hypothetical protein
MLQLLLKEQGMGAREALVNLADQYHITPVYLALQRCAALCCAAALQGRPGSELAAGRPAGGRAPAALNALRTAAVLSASGRS